MAAFAAYTGLRWGELAGYASIRITLDMYIGTTAGTLDRARTATQ